MRRFITYLYVYKDGQKTKNIGYIRVDVQEHVLDMQVNIKVMELNDVKGDVYVIVKKDEIFRIFLAEILMESGQYNGRILCDCMAENACTFGFQDIIGIGVSYENGDYIASCWKDGEEAVVAEYENLRSKTSVAEQKMVDNEENVLESRNKIEGDREQAKEEIIAASVEEICERKTVYRKMNLNELHALPSKYWHFSNNSFLIHGFWNYGYLVLKESVEEDAKGIALGVPGIFEQPEKVMATYFGFPQFEALPLQTMEMEIGECFVDNQEQKNQQPQMDTFGCWFTDL